MKANKKILIVEDELIVAEDIADTLKSLGYSVVDIVPSGEKAIEAASQTQPDLVLMDIMLPGKIDGVEAAEEIRRECDIPVVYLTAYADEKTVERATVTEPFGYLIKPFEEKELRTTIEIALRRHQVEQNIKGRVETAEKMRKQAEEERDRHSHYVCMASHEFRHPLTTIFVTSEILKQYGAQLTEDKKLKHFDSIQSAVRSMNEMLEDVLTIGSADSGKIAFNPIPLDLVDFCAELVEALQHGAESQHAIQFIAEGDFSDAVMDNHLLHHILTNLISNAIKYSPHGGTVRLQLKREGDRAILRVQDEGIGIPATEQAQLFEAFHRATNVGNIPGTGLGLAIVKRSVDLHGGEVAVESEVGIGTTFTVTLPLHSH